MSPAGRAGGGVSFYLNTRESRLAALLFIYIYIYPRWFFLQEPTRRPPRVKKDDVRSHTAWRERAPIKRKKARFMNLYFREKASHQQRAFPPPALRACSRQ